ncbi:MAG: response regulator [Candidatus Electryonea clarkiae]|nr:response regulator [Candidatus Electryonea clarkiae]
MKINEASASILIVDDMENNRILLQDMIQALGHKTTLAVNGLDALSLMKFQLPDLVLLDILMPEMDGYTVLENIKADDKMNHIPVIMITAVDETESVIHCLELGADDYIVKPFNSSLLEARIRGSLEKKRLWDAEQDLLEKTLKGSIRVLVEILSLSNPKAFSRSLRIQKYVRLIVKSMKLKDQWSFEVAALLSQLGSITLPDEILEKSYETDAMKLSKGELKLFKSLPSLSKKILEKIPRLEMIAAMIGEQQRVYGFDTDLDGVSKKSKNIYLGGDILRVALEYDNLVMNGEPGRKALEILGQNSSYCNPKVVEALASQLLNEIKVQAVPLNINELKPGMILDEHVRAKKSKMMLASRGTVITEIMIERLKVMSKTIGVIEPFDVFLS